MRKLIIRDILVILLLSNVLGGCATFYTPKESKKELEPSLKNSSVALDIHLTVKGYRGKVSTSNINEAYRSREDKTFDYEKLDEGIKQITSIFEHDGKINTFLTGKKKKANLNLRLHYIYDGEYDNAHYSWQWLTAVTVGLVPFWQKRNVKLTAELLDPRGKVKKKYSYLEEGTDVKHLFLLPLALFYQSDSATKEMVKNITKRLVADLKKDKVI